MLMGLVKMLSELYDGMGVYSCQRLECSLCWTYLRYGIGSKRLWSVGTCSGGSGTLSESLLG
jgi:hypothetical protein